MPVWRAKLGTAWADGIAAIVSTAAIATRETHALNERHGFISISPSSLPDAAPAIRVITEHEDLSAPRALMTAHAGHLYPNTIGDDTGYLPIATSRTGK
jgi:hypothetical protein